MIAFYGSDAEGSIITHRVVSNSSAMGEFITKGDANEENDMNPVTYNQYMGKMVRSIPKIGGIVQTITGGSGKAAVGCVIGLAIVLEIIAAVLNRRLEDDRGRIIKPKADYKEIPLGENALYEKRSKKNTCIRLTLICQYDINESYMVCY